MIERRYDLKLLDGRTVSWVGTDGINASERYVDAMRVAGKDVAVVAWREPRTYVGPVHHSQIIG
jgi:hypothetical protein